METVAGAAGAAANSVLTVTSIGTVAPVSVPATIASSVVMVVGVGTTAQGILGIFATFTTGYGDGGGEPPQLARGKRAHNEEPVLPGEKKEVPTPSGKRMDRYNEKEYIIREIKPNNKRGIKAGEKQVKGYCDEMEAETGKPHTGVVSPYDPSKYDPK